MFERKKRNRIIKSVRRDKKKTKKKHRLRKRKNERITNVRLGEKTRK